MHNFADSVLPFPPRRDQNEAVAETPLTYSDLFHQIIGQPLDSFADSLAGQMYHMKGNDCSDDVKTFCFEMCSERNRVIRHYPKPSLYLIAAFGGINGSAELKIPKELVLPVNVHHTTIIEFPPILTIAYVKSKIQEMSSSDCTFEGLVLQTSENNERIKVKRNYYTLQHYFKYRGFTWATPELLIPLIFDKMDEKVIENVSKCIERGSQDDGRVVELNFRRNRCTDVIESKREEILRVLQSNEHGESCVSTMNVKDYIDFMNCKFAVTFKE